ncbi:RNA polymerase-associated protein RapA [bacterium HR40]|nr:RNA polymerase-associated protein RapA [bacterium HR40]
MSEQHRPISVRLGGAVQGGTRRILLPGHFDGPVELEDVRALGGDSPTGYECRVRLPDGTLHEVTISAEEAARILGAAEAAAGSTLAPVDAERLRLWIEAARIRLAFAHDRQLAVSLSAIRTLPHQIEAVYEVMLPQPRLRFLLADDPGAGKTIMAGLLIKEMKLRGAIERVLILCPAPLTIQWQDELLRWFGESFDIVFSGVDQRHLNPWQRSPQVIASIDYAKQDEVRERVWQQHWDLVVIDEAHKCAAYTKSRTGRSAEVAETKRYQLAKRLCEQADHVLLLTATPHHGDEDRFAHFLRLLDPDLFPEPHRLAEEARTIRKEVLKLGKNSPWCLRRLKEDLRDLHGRRLFPDRHAKTVTFRLSREEYALYKKVTAYINEFIPHSQQSGPNRSSAALTRIVLQRRLVSSTRAIHESLKRRLKKQQDLLDELQSISTEERRQRLQVRPVRQFDVEQDEDDLDEEVRDRLVSEFTSARDLHQLREEIHVLKELVDEADYVRKLGMDSKLLALKQCLSQSQFAELKDGQGKLIIFTEHRDTLEYIREHLENWGYRTCEIHGGMDPQERKHAQERFLREAQVCVATEAAGEGINLQFCHLMINYDMPWNPTRLEQRLGRIHRIGQDRDVFVFNFVATDSEDGEPIVEGRILQRLLAKLETMNEALEGRVFDVIGEVLSLNDVNLPDMLREAACDPRRLDEYLDQIDRIDPAKLKEYENATGIALARSHVDFTAFQRGNLEVEENRLMPRYVEAHFLAAAKEVGLRVERRADGLWRIEQVPSSLRSERLKAVQRLGKPDSSYRKITFHKEHLEQRAHMDAVLVGPGHPLYAAVEEKLDEKLGIAPGRIAFYVDPLATEPYWIAFFELSILGKDSKGNDVCLYGEMVAVRQQAGDFTIVPNDVLLDLPAHRNPPPRVEPVDVQAAMDYLKCTRQLALRERVREERRRYAEICREYLERSFAARIKRAQERTMALQAEEHTKPELKLAVAEAAKYVDELEQQKKERLSGLQRLELVRTGPVRHLATVMVLPPGADPAVGFVSPADEAEPSLRRQSELAAEERVVAALREEGFPEDCIERVGHQKLGFDIRAYRVADPATGALFVKRIEVKGRMRGQAIRLTTNEWYKAQQLAETYWLYVVWDPLGRDPELVRINNPAARLEHAAIDLREARFVEIPAKAVMEAAERGGRE